jgi:hypothetical protein
MYRSFRALAGPCVAALIVGCAMSAPADTTPGVDPSLPGVDAGNDPRPASGGGGGGSDGGRDQGSSGSSGSSAPDAGPQGITADAAPVDAAPAIPKPSAGELFISEIMYTTFTPEPASEWIEVHSAATAARSLSGLTLKDGGGRTHVIAPGLTIAPGAYVVLARNKTAALAAKVPSSAVVYEYGAGLPDNAGIILANGATGGIAVLDGSAMIANAPYGSWFSQSGGSSLQLKILDASQSAQKASWCLSLNAWTTGSEKGTPGVASDCP